MTPLFLLFWVGLGLIGGIGIGRILKIQASGLNITFLIFGVVLLGDFLFIVWLVALGIIHLRDKIFNNKN